MKSFYIIGYLIIYLPFIFCLINLSMNFKVAAPTNFALCNFLILIIALFLFFSLSNLQLELINKKSSSIISIFSNYEINILGLFFIIFISFIQLCTSDLKKFFQKNHLENSNFKKIFYNLNLLKLMFIIGIFTSSNIFNLFIFLELYSISFYAIICASKEKYLNKLVFKYFYQSNIGSMMILTSFIGLYLKYSTSEMNQIRILMNNETSLFDNFIFLIILTFGIILKFFPFWIYFKNIRTTNYLSSFLAIKFLLIKNNIGFFLILKTIFFLFGKDLIFNIFHLDVILFIISFIFIFYGSFKIIKNSNLKVINSYFSIVFLGFFLLSISLNKIDANISIFYYIAHYNFITLLLIVIYSYMRLRFNNCNIKNLNLIAKDKSLVKYYFRIITPIICAFPFTLLFFANWNLTSAIIDSDTTYIYFSFIPILITFLVSVYLSVKMFSYFNNENNINLHLKKRNNLQDNIHHLISLPLIVTILLFLMIKPLLFEKMAYNIAQLL